MTYQELVKKVQTALVKADASTITDHIAVQVNVTGEAEGAFYIEIKDGVLYVEPYDYNDRDFLLTADSAEILAVAQGKISLVTAIADSKVFHEGNYDKTIALSEIIPAAKKSGRKPKASAQTEEAPAATKKPVRKAKAGAGKTEETPAVKEANKKTKAETPKTEEAAKTEKTAAPVVEEVPAVKITETQETTVAAPAKKTRKPKSGKTTETPVDSVQKKKGRKAKKSSK